MFKGEYLTAYGTINYEIVIMEASRKDIVKWRRIKRWIKGDQALSANRSRAEVYIVRSIRRQEFHMLGNVES